MASQVSYSTRTTCRACGSADLVELFSLGEQLVNDFPASKPCQCAKDVGHGVAADYPIKITCPLCGGDPRLSVVVPITLDLCRNCTLVQARHSPPPDLLYRRHYHYRSGVTDTMRAALADVAEACQRAVDLKPGDVVLDIGSNDGTLLRCYSDTLTRIGCEPADNLATPENYRGLDLVHDFWPFTSGRPGFKAKIVTAAGMFYDLEDPNPFIADVAKALHPDGVFVAQLMCLRQMLRQNDVGNLAHEHLEFYTLKSLCRLFAKHGLLIYDVEENDVNGGSYRIFARHVKPPLEEKPQIVLKALHAEKRAGLGEDAVEETVKLWFLNQQEIKERLVSFLRREVAAGKRCWVYGASTKGNSLLQWWGIDARMIEAAAERDPAKWGRHTVNGIPIVAEANFRANNPDYALVLPFAFLNEMVERERDWLMGGRQFIVPLPQPRRLWIDSEGLRKEAPL